MTKKINIFLIFAISLAILYFFLRSGEHLVVWAYFLALSGLYLSKHFKHLVLITSVASAFIASRFFYHAPVETGFAIFLFALMIPIPYYYHRETKKTEGELREKNRAAKRKYDKLILEHAASESERKKTEEEIEKIMQLYIIGRELSKKILFEDYAEIIISSMSKRIGVSSVSIFDKSGDSWKIVASSKPYQKNGWQEYGAVEHSFDDIYDCVIVKNPVFINENEATVVWPLKLEGEILGSIIIVCDKSFSEDYVKEGAIFAPQIALSAKRVKLFGEVNEKSRNDGLTGLLRRSFFLERLKYEIQREKRYSTGFYILMLDIDFFKNVNDKYGHLEGDRVLRSIAETFAGSIRPQDLAARYGGEEFIIFMPQAKQYEAIATAESIRKAVELQKYRYKDSEFGVTISIGVSGYPADGAALDKIIKAADDALYKAKRDGRNQVVLHSAS